ncbi:S-adenosylmethionine synthetase [Photorhabdus australis subsp. thailandensis]|uniref:S-adenosylmethionine synthetase n=1 Tax=Photorhabdus australis subsp. thailandensis TaxID=2805096 RepID=A0A1C0TZ44_9GAMM|nr:methionine adenosyltransferase [Photorhabdus australis]OCQ50938.1 S-adenosylmethionine synthetase [Photorhabdus australis subsp. thailandensis]
MEIFFEQKSSNLQFEHVERKGAGHPDTICDAIAEKASAMYANYCLNKFGKVAHHWFDKTMLIGGESNIGFGVGEIIKPYMLIFAGKVSYYVGKHPIPVDSILRSAVKDVLDNCLTGFDIERHVVIENKLVDYQGAGRSESRYRPDSVDQLPSLENYHQFTSNDCNLVSGYAPLTTLENMVLKIEQIINSVGFKSIHPYSGWDVKVFGTRENEQYSIIVNMPILGKFCSSIADYKVKVESARLSIESFITDIFGSIDLYLELNPQDRRGKPYITAIGSAADTGDVGVVGRGNRLNGLITPMRPMSIEAPAGKNPVDHTGKIYGLFANQVAQYLYEKYNKYFEIHIYTLKESYLVDPDKVLISSDYLNGDEMIEVEKIVREKLGQINTVISDLILEKAQLW